jgi:hypothetical protein
MEVKRHTLANAHDVPPLVASGAPPHDSKKPI